MFRALNRVASAATRQRAEFVNKAIKTQEARTRQAYLAKPDWESEADNWSNAGVWKAGRDERPARLR